MSDVDSTTIFKEVESLPGYRIGSDGTVQSHWSFANGRWVIGPWRSIKTHKNNRGRMMVNLSYGGKAKWFQVSRLVLLAFVGECPEGMECCHNDGNCLNNNLSNLRWDTRSANAMDKVNHGTHARGENFYGCKIKTSDLAAIREMVASGVSQTKTAEKYGVHQSVISRICSGKRRAWG